jgi:hypothetical protein
MMGRMADSDNVTISMTSDESLVLFELLHRWEDHDEVSPPEHPAEQTALWNLSALLERVLVEPFRSDYAALVEAARQRLAPE